jgi:hypothetical protein
MTTLILYQDDIEVFTNLFCQYVSLILRIEYFGPMPWAREVKHKGNAGNCVEVGVKTLMTATSICDRRT